MPMNGGHEPRGHIYIIFPTLHIPNSCPPMNRIGDHVQCMSASIKGLSIGHVVAVSTFSPLTS